MNYIISFALGLCLEAAAVLGLSLGNSLRIFHTNDSNLNLAILLISLVFLTYCISFGIYYHSAAKEAGKTFRIVPQDTLNHFMMKSIIFLAVSDAAIILLAVINGLATLIKDTTFFPLPSLLLMIVLYALLYVLVFLKFQPKGISFRSK